MKIPKPTTRLLSLLLPVLAALALLVASSPARAQDQGSPQSQETIDKVVELNREGVALYRKKRFDAARQALKQALDLCEAAGLDRHPIAARTHLHLGIVIVGGFGQREIGGKQFSAALEIQPDIMLTPGVASPAVEDVFNEALVAVTPRGSAPAAPRASGEADVPESAAPVDTEAPPRMAATAGDADARAERRGRPPSAGGDEDDDEEGGKVPSARVQLGALLGGDVGWASGMGDLNADTPVPGSFAGSKLSHLTVEAGYWLTSTFMLSVQGRFQMVSGATLVQARGRTYEPASGAAAAFAAATWSPATGRLRPFVSAALGGGSIRHVVTLGGLKDCGAAHNEVCVDTVGAGPFLAGAGGGLTFDLGERLGLVAAVSTQLGAPHFTFNVDVNAGVAFHL
jgi:hypothetical protein